jgi:hypothetical protein
MDTLLRVEAAPVAGAERFSELSLLAAFATLIQVKEKRSRAR